MREILFRGKDKDGRWHYGRLAYKFVDVDMAEVAVDVIQDENHVTWQVAPDIVSQYTGLCDKYGNKIFEGDILLNEYDDEYYLVDFNEGAFSAIADMVICSLPDVAITAVIVDNRWDNTELFPQDE